MLSYVVCDVHHVSWLVNEQVFGASRRSTAIEKVSAESVCNGPEAVKGR